MTGKINILLIILEAIAICCFIPKALEQGYFNYIQTICIAIDSFLISAQFKDLLNG